MQNYTEIADTTGITESRALLLDNTKTVMSCHSGTVAPTTNLQVGMLFHNTAENRYYYLESTGPDVWTALVTTKATEEDTSTYRMLTATDSGKVLHFNSSDPVKILKTLQTRQY